MQKDFGTGVVLFVVLLAMLFAAGARVIYLFGALVAAAPVVYHLVRYTPYRWQRVVAFLDPVRYRETVGFQLFESLLVTSKGGWLGQGLGQGRSRLFYLPAAHTDFIAAVIAEEAGLLGLLLLLGLFGVLVWRGLRAARRAENAFGCYAALGMTALVGGQALLNLAVVLGMLPTKGLTLPFVSYGGSSLLTLLGGAGVLLAVSAERGGFLVRAPGAVRVGAPIGTVPRLDTIRAEEAR
jgi:cell division protein FtsW